jgi:AcrR family transcriptional regulator
VQPERARPNAGGDATRSALIDAAERLFAERGIAGVSLREIGVAAGQRKSNAAQYHFGDRDGLVRAILLARSAGVNQRRQALLESAGPDGDGLARALVEPLAADLTAGGHYLRFVFQLLVASEGRVPFAPDLDPETTASFREVVRRLRDALPDLDEVTVRTRVELAIDFVVMALADRAAAERRPGSARPSRSRFVAEVVRATAGILGLANK